MVVDCSRRDMPFDDIPQRRSQGDCSAGRRCHEMASILQALALQSGTIRDESEQGLPVEVDVSMSGRMGPVH